MRMGDDTKLYQFFRGHMKVNLHKVRQNIVVLTHLRHKLWTHRQPQTAQNRVTN